LFFAELLFGVIVAADHMPWEIATQVAVIAGLPSLKPDFSTVVNLRYATLS